MLLVSVYLLFKIICNSRNFLNRATRLGYNFQISLRDPVSRVYIM
jgi:hypothetical protein